MSTLNFLLATFHQISGIGSASGLVFRDDKLFIIADSSGWLFEYDLQTKTLGKILLFENPLNQNIPKRQKPDFEAIVSFDNELYIFGSGSTPNRNKLARFNLLSKTIEITDLSSLYLRMQNAANITAADFNIEGAVFTGEVWYFLQRGNGQSGQNGIFTVRGKNFDVDSAIQFQAYILPKIKGIPTTFTDAVLVDDQLYFLAAAEDSKSTYEDGELLGSLVGCIDLKTMNLTVTQQISGLHKFEGIALYRKTADQIEFLLCEDNDSNILESEIYKLTFKIN